MSHIENAKAAIEEHIKSSVVDQAQKTSEGAKSKTDNSKKTASIFSSLDDLTADLLAEKQVADDKQKLNKMMSDTKALAAKSGKDAKSSKSGKNDKSSAPSGKSKDAPAPAGDDKEPMDPLLALVMAGIDNQTQTNEIITALGKGGEEVSLATTDAATAGNAWQKNFYNHGLTSTGDENPGQYNTGKAWQDTSNGKAGINPSGGDSWMIWVDGHYKTVPGYPTIPTQAQVQAALGPGLKVNYDNYTAACEWCKDNGSVGKDRGFEGTSAMEPVSNGIPGATGSDHSAEFNALIQVWQYVQQQVSQINNQFQTVAGLPSTMMQTLTQAVNTANSGQSSTVQAMGTTTNLVNGWAGV